MARYKIKTGKGPGKWEILRAIADFEPISFTLICERRKPIYFEISVMVFSLSFAPEVFQFEAMLADALADPRCGRNSWDITGCLCDREGSALARKGEAIPELHIIYSTRTRDGSVESEVELIKF